MRMNFPSLKRANSNCSRPIKITEANRYSAPWRTTKLTMTTASAAGDHARPPAKNRGNEADYKGGVQTGQRANMRNQSEGDCLLHQRKGDGQAAQNINLELGRLEREHKYSIGSAGHAACRLKGLLGKCLPDTERENPGRRMRKDMQRTGCYIGTPMVSAE